MGAKRSEPARRRVPRIRTAHTAICRRHGLMTVSSARCADRSGRGPMRFVSRTARTPEPTDVAGRDPRSRHRPARPPPCRRRADPGSTAPARTIAAGDSPAGARRDRDGRARPRGWADRRPARRRTTRPPARTARPTAAAGAAAGLAAPGRCSRWSAAFFAWVSAEPLWLAVGHGDARHRDRDPLHRRRRHPALHRASFAAADGAFTARRVYACSASPRAARGRAPSVAGPDGRRRQRHGVRRPTGR